MKYNRKLILPLIADCGDINLKSTAPENVIKVQRLKSAQNVATKANCGVSVKEEIKICRN